MTASLMPASRNNGFGMLAKFRRRYGRRNSDVSQGEWRCYRLRQLRICRRNNRAAGQDLFVVGKVLGAVQDGERDSI